MFRKEIFMEDPSGSLFQNPVITEKQRVTEFEKKEHALALSDVTSLREFSQKVSHNKSKLLNLLHDLKRSGKRSLLLTHR